MERFDLIVRNRLVWLGFGIAALLIAVMWWRGWFIEHAFGAVRNQEEATPLNPNGFGDGNFNSFRSIESQARINIAAGDLRPFISHGFNEPIPHGFSCEYNFYDDSHSLGFFSDIEGETETEPALPWTDAATYNLILSKEPKFKEITNCVPDSFNR